MDWMREIDGYCERLGPDYWAEPINAVTNLFFIISALIMWRRVPADAGLARALVLILAAIGVGSYLFHTHAQVWAAIADTTPILLFILVYIFAAHRDIWGLRPLPALGATALFFPYAAVMVPLFGLIPGLGGSAGYAPVPLLIALHAVALRRREPEVARGFAIGAGVLTVSILFRTLDEPLCGIVPMGTHFMWHFLNAVMLGWMIEVYRRHLLQGGYKTG
ncbi:ceramidase domain-containing protein [Lutimaribacter marinistellae]|uniref:Ceramidase domain-containing protein n=1 Tax=Lutimaribacter marinistellae TaxID=1820329 RepID=A0ABV7TIR6_9RHOB